MFSSTFPNKIKKINDYFRGNVSVLFLLTAIYLEPCLEFVSLTL